MSDESVQTPDQQVPSVTRDEARRAVDWLTQAFPVAYTQAEHDVVQAMLEDFVSRRQPPAADQRGAGNAQGVPDADYDIVWAGLSGIAGSHGLSAGRAALNRMLARIRSLLERVERYERDEPRADIASTPPTEAPSHVRHVCGARGFGLGADDRCEACEAQKDKATVADRIAVTPEDVDRAATVWSAPGFGYGRSFRERLRAILTDYLSRRSPTGLAAPKSVLTPEGGNG